MNSWYGIVKHIHMSAAMLSVALFFMRGNWMIFRPERLQQRWVKMVPHVIDTVLLVSALVLAYQFLQFPVPRSWLAAKIAGLLVYIGLGMIALKRGKTLAIRITAFIAALVTVGYIYAVAFSKQPWPFG